MRSRFHSGWKALVLAAFVAGLVLLPVTSVLAAGLTPFAAKAKSPLATPLSAGDEIKQPTVFPRSNYVWRYAFGPNYGEVDPSEWARPYVLHTAVGSFDLTRGLPNLPDELRATVSLSAGKFQHFFVQVHPDAFGDGSFDQIRDTITGAGGAIVQEMANGAFLVRMNSVARAAIDGMPGVYVEPYHPAFKLAPNIGRAPLPDPLRAVSDIYRLELKIFQGEDAGAVATAVTALGGSIVSTFGDALVVDLHRDKLADVAALESVEMVFESLPQFTKGEETTTTMQTGAWNSGVVPYFLAGINGGGCASCVAAVSPQFLMVLDAGISMDAADISDTRTASGFNAATATHTCTDQGGGCDGAGRAHRKVRVYLSAGGFGGSGDLLACDANQQGGFTHGQVVSATALGNATDVETFYGAGQTKADPAGNPWKLDGVAHRALLLAYDAQVTPVGGGCNDPGNSGLTVGDISTSLADAYTRGARTSNFSWGSTNNHVYALNAQRVDNFLNTNKDAMVFISAGNESIDSDQDGFADLNTVSDPATAKNAVIVGASGNANDTAGGFGPRNRAGFSSVGPATAGSNRLAPLVMAPGLDFGGMGLGSENNCRSSDNDQSNPVECDVIQGFSGTSFASPAAAGANLLIRDYFAKGFFPDGTNANPGNDSDKEPNISGALSKALLVASAEWMSAVSTTPPALLHFTYRPNFEQGYGRVQLNNVLPLATYASPIGLLVTDGGGVAGAPNNLGLDGTIGVLNETDTTTLNMCDTTQVLKVALTWIESSGDSVAHNLNLELVSPTLRTYFGNYSTDDANKNGVLDGGENCNYVNTGGGAVPWPPATVNQIDSSQWNIPNACGVAVRDSQNNVEGIFLSPDPAGNGITDNPATTTINEAADNQIEQGTWTLKVIGATVPSSQGYAVAVAGPVCAGSTARIQILKATGDLVPGNFACNDRAVVTINEVSETGDTTPTVTQVSNRTTLQVIDPGPNKIFESALGTGISGDDILKDTESALTFTDDDGGSPGLKFTSTSLVLTNGTAPQAENDALDITDGWSIKVTYQDVGSTGLPDPNKVRNSSALVDCRSLIQAGGVLWTTYGRDAFTLVSGGCDKDARGLFTTGFPDKYMDEKEVVGYRIAFQSGETEVDLVDTQVSLKAVATDLDSPPTCKPGTTDCADPNRANNPLTPHLTVLDSPKIIGTVPPGQAVSANFSVQVASSGIPALTKIEMVLGISASKSGRPFESFVVSGHTLDVDESSLFYSTDFPVGGFEIQEKNNNESLENPATDPGDIGGFLNRDYFFEGTGVAGTNPRNYADLTATGTNTAAGMKAPWNFDSNNGGFTVVLNNISTRSASFLTTLAQWGEDKNGNDLLDAGEDRDPSNGALDNNWNTRGGCGWTTRIGAQTATCDATNRCGSWHTGRIDVQTVTACLGTGQQPNQRCQRYEAIPGVAAVNQWFEILLSPLLHKVNQCDGIGDPAVCDGRVDTTLEKVFNVEFKTFAFNSLIDINDQLTALTMELDNDADKLQPADLVNDGTVTQPPLFGLQGAIAGGNAPLTNGFPLYANIGHCTDTNQDFIPDHCSNALATACTNDTPCNGLSHNGVVGPNRIAKNNCYFEGKVAGDTSLVKALEPYGLPLPPDDDVRNGWCVNSENALDKSATCNCTVAPASCAAANAHCASLGPPYATTCTFQAGVTVDQYIQANGPVRNYDITMVNGPDLVFNTIEDVQEDSGISFQAALGFYTSEGTTNTVPHASYGVGVDDLVVGWREFKLVQDTKNCDAVGNGQCADIELGSTNLYDGNGLITITVTDTTPYSFANPNKNDCNLDDDFTDPTDDNDCDNNGVVDLVARAFSESEVNGEVVVLNRVTTIGSGGVYKGTIPVSVTYNSPGALFIAKQGSNNPTVTAEYIDRNISATSPDVVCANDQDVNKRGSLQTSTVVVVSSGEMIVQKLRLIDNGDSDPFADTKETVSLFVTLINNSDLDLDTVTLGLASNNTNVDCISRPIVDFGSIKAVDDPATPSVDEHIKETPTPFIFHVSAALNRVNVDDILQAVFTLTAQSDKFDVLARDTLITLDLDLNASGGGAPTTYTEGFESGTFNTFTSMNLDDGKASNILSDGYRCQYNDPDGPNPNEADRAGCFLGFPNADDNKFDWHVHTTAMNDGGRAYDGTRSVHYGVHPITGPSFDTTRLQQLDAIRMIDPINLGFSNVAPELSFKHQISLVDNRTTNTANGFAADRGVVHMQLADNAGNAIGDWVKLFPFENPMDAQGVDHFFNCTFDPIDDGNDEDSFFDPDDPFRRTGPSSTCFPEFAFVYQGDTDYRNPANPDSLGRAVDGPGLAGSIDRGTWVQPKFNLSQFLGRRMRLRFLATSIEVTGTVTYDVFGLPANEIGDDGWYIDGITVTDCLTSPATFLVDGTNNSGLPGCGSCSSITASLTADDTQLDAPGQIVTLDASASTADFCSGVLQYKFWTDLFSDGILTPGVDTVLRDWTDNPILLDAPPGNTRYTVQVRCAADPTCDAVVDQAQASLSIGVTCPGIGGSLDPGPFPQTINVSKGTAPTINLTWTTATIVDAIRGDLTDLRSNGGNFSLTVEACLANNLTVNSVADSTVVAAGFGKYYMVRIGDPQCNEQGTWSTGTAQEAAGRNIETNASANTCP